MDTGRQILWDLHPLLSLFLVEISLDCSNKALASRGKVNTHATSFVPLGIKSHVPKWPAYPVPGSLLL